MTEQKEAQQAAERSVDDDALLEGEDPSSDLVEDAEHWIAVYRELVSYKRTLLGTSAEEIVSPCRVATSVSWLGPANAACSSRSIAARTRSGRT